MIIINDKKTKDLAVHFLNISIDDLKAADVLYKNGCYPQAIFYLQQAMEKLIKSNGYYFNIINESNKIDGKNVIHATWKIYCKFFERINNSKWKELLNQKIQKKIINNSPVLKFIFDKYKKEYKFKRRNFKYLFKFLLKKDINIIIKNTNFSEEIILKTIRQNFLLKHSISELMNPISSDNNKFNQNFNFLNNLWNYLKIFGIIVFTGVQLIFQLYMFSLFSIDLSIILFKYVNIARYGDENKLQLPNEILTSKHILLKEFNEIYRIIDNMQKFYSKLIIQNIT